MDWLAAHWSDIIEIALQVLGVASLVARMTPTEADNKVVDAVFGFVHFFGLTRKAPPAPPA